MGERTILLDFPNLNSDFWYLVKAVESGMGYVLGLFG
jgi:hypothetical protein